MSETQHDNPGGDDIRAVVVSEMTATVDDPLFLDGPDLLALIRGWRDRLRAVGQIGAPRP